MTIRGTKAIIVACGILLTLIISYQLSLHSINPIPMVRDLRQVAIAAVINSYAPGGEVSSNVPEVVNAVIWDFRGLDTFFETSVLFVSLIAAVSILRKEAPIVPEGGKPSPTLIPRTVYKVIVPASLAVAGAMALKGHITPGGGFQAGAVIAVTIFIGLALLPDLFVKPLQARAMFLRLLTLRSTALLVLVVVAVLPVIVTLPLRGEGFVLQNTLFPPYVSEGKILSAYVLILNVVETLAVSLAFTIVALLLWAAFEVGTRE